MTVLNDMSGNYWSVYIRHTFQVPDPSALGNLILCVTYDDGFVAYLNGVEVARASVIGAPPAFNETSGDHEAAPVDFPLDAQDVLVAGENVLAVQAHNTGADSSDFSIIPELLNDEREFIELIAEGEEWTFFRGLEEPSPAADGSPTIDWTELAFDDGEWELGPAGFGYGDGDDATELSDMSGGYLSVYIRHFFEVEDPGALSSLLLLVSYDDGFVAYLNGVEIARAGMTGTPPAFDSTPGGDHEAGGFEEFINKGKPNSKNK